MIRAVINETNVKSPSKIVANATTPPLKKTEIFMSIQQRLFITKMRSTYSKYLDKLIQKTAQIHQLEMHKH